MRIIGLYVAAILTSLTLSVPALAQSPSSPQADETALPVVKLSPAVRSTATDPYGDLPCEALGTVSPETEAQHRAFKRRAKACLEAHSAFMPSTSSPGPR